MSYDSSCKTRIMRRSPWVRSYRRRLIEFMINGNTKYSRFNLRRIPKFRIWNVNAIKRISNTNNKSTNWKKNGNSDCMKLSWLKRLRLISWRRRRGILSWRFRRNISSRQRSGLWKWRILSKRRINKSKVSVRSENLLKLSIDSLSIGLMKNGNAN